MKFISRIGIGLKAVNQLGPTQVGLYGLYRLGLRTGHYQRRLDAALRGLKASDQPESYRFQPCLPSPDRQAMIDLLRDQDKVLFEQADEIVDGKVRLFGSEPVPLVLDPQQPLEYWTKYERGDSRPGEKDIKFIWEPGRFGWACTLARAYYLSGNEQFAESFWDYTERFLSSNPPYFGPHWASSQEVGIRMIALVFAFQLFIHSSHTTPKRIEDFTRTIAVHAQRIPPTLVYARSQNNNHLITEALGLYTASAILPQHPIAPKWHRLGWNWLQYAFVTQIDPDGTYIQHSTNYHRLMLQAALWAFAVHDHSFTKEPIATETVSRLAATTSWLWKLADPETGHVPNLGHNDGAYILPLTLCPYPDYRPVIYAAANRFLQLELVPLGAWCEMGNWLCISSKNSQSQPGFIQYRGNQSAGGIIQPPPHILQDQKSGSWVSINVARFHARPAHADQLHIDMWWRGLNIALDPGTYLYNDAPPWDNSLTSALVHNTVTVDGKEFMQKASRFLYLDWAQAEVVGNAHEPGLINPSWLTEHNGYRRLGVRHQRLVTSEKNGHWKIDDRIEGSSGRVHTARLHWLLPDWEYEIREYPESTEYLFYEVRIRSPYGWITLQLGTAGTDVKSVQIRNSSFQLVRAGKLMYGSGTAFPFSGWTSTTYGDKIPALACILEITQSLPIKLKSLWILPNET